MLSLRTRLLAGAKRSYSTGTVVQVYKTPSIPYLDQHKKIPGLLSEQGLQNAWYKRGDMYCDALNQEIASSGLAPHDVDVLVKEFAKSPSKLNLFNNASLLSNVEFAFRSLGEVRDHIELPKLDESSLLASPDISTEVENLPNNEFLKWIDSSFGSVLEFKTLLLNSANAINGDGFTWLVARARKSQKTSEAEYDDLFVLNTYNGGTPDNSIRFGQITELSDKLKKLEETHGIKSSSSSSILTLQEAREIGGYSNVSYKPILAIDVSPKIWLHDYGVFGKKQYLEQVWKSIDWDIVQKRVPKRATENVSSDYY